MGAAVLPRCISECPKHSRPLQGTGLSDEAIRAIWLALEREYGNPRHGNKRDPLDELVYIILSNRTAEPTFRSTFRRVKREFPSWDDLTPSC